MAAPLIDTGGVVAPALALVAGEASGDLLGAALLAALLQRWPSLRAAGIGGPRMQATGFHAWWPSDKLAVRGYVEVLRHYPELLGIRSRLGDRLIEVPPRLFIGIDAPDFNLKLEQRLRAHGVACAHFVCPSIWAWRPGRVEQLKRSCDHVLCIFPFEPALLAPHGIAATYVGHPLAAQIAFDADPAPARAALGLPADAPVVALLPGSRASEVQYLAPTFFEAARQMQSARPAIEFVVPTLAPLRPAVEAAARAAGLVRGLTLVTGRSHEALAACDATLIASGTATLEAALAGRPMVIAYRMNPLSYALMRRRQLQPWVGLPNILLEDFAVPELLQQSATPRALAQAMLDWLDEPARIAAVKKRFSGLHGLLARDTARLATDALESLIAR